MRSFLLFVNIINFGIYVMSASEAIANGLIIATTVSFLCVVLLSLCLVLSGRDSAFSPLVILLLINLYSNVARLNLIAVDPQLMQIKYYMATLSTEMLNDGAILVGLGTLSICRAIYLRSFVRLGLISLKKCRPLISLGLIYFSGHFWVY